MTASTSNTAAVITPTAAISAKYRKAPHSALPSGVLGKVYFTPGNAGYPVFQTRYARVGVYICTTAIS